MADLIFDLQSVVYLRYFGMLIKLTYPVLVQVQKQRSTCTEENKTIQHTRRRKNRNPAETTRLDARLKEWASPAKHIAPIIRDDSHTKQTLSI